MGNILVDKKSSLVALQFIGWCVIVATTLLWSVSLRDGVFDLFGFAVFGVNICSLIVIYLLNYLLFIPRLFFCERRTLFVWSNIALIIALLAVSYIINERGLLDFLRPENRPPRPNATPMYLARELINYILMIGLVTAMRLSERLQRSEEALREAESARVKAELANLRSQINPHFLLNTLNNIYALTAIDPDQAQTTIKELSNLLRYILYDNLNERVPLKGEVEFIKTYIQLMSIRLPRKVRLSTDFKISEGCTTQIAPLIFISLIENAFKHSVSASGEGFIEIYFEDRVESGEVILSIENSNHAKAEQDKSGHGVGLEQVRRRLELLYPASHRWDVDSDSHSYKSVLTLKTLSR